MSIQCHICGETVDNPDAPDVVGRRKWAWEVKRRNNSSDMLNRHDLPLRGERYVPIAHVRCINKVKAGLLGQEELEL